MVQVHRHHLTQLRQVSDQERQQLEPQLLETLPQQLLTPLEPQELERQLLPLHQVLAV
jgi:hypothetical protein